jgi:hypothetical protein
MPNQIAPPGQVYVCSACGRRSRDRYGDQRIDCNWDESCMMHAVLCVESSLKVENGRVGEATAVED